LRIIVGVKGGVSVLKGGGVAGEKSEEVGLVIQIARAEKLGVEGRKSVIFASDVIGWGEASENWGVWGRNETS
jgi:hypothetical protein